MTTAEAIGHADGYVKTITNLHEGLTDKGRLYAVALKEQADIYRTLLAELARLQIENARLTEAIRLGLIERHGDFGWFARHPNDVAPKGFTSLDEALQHVGLKVEGGRDGR